ncbi:MAG: DUF3311 domain-containing protein [Gemmatimonadaceae bacterium]
MRRYRWLAVIPTIGMLGGIPFANRVQPYILGLPFLLAWVVMWVIATSLIMAIVYSLDNAHDSEAASTSAGVDSSSVK